MRRGLIAEFVKPVTLVDAVRALAAAGVRGLETFTPYPLEELDPLLPKPRSPVSRVAGVCAVLGGGSAYLLQWWTSAVSYPLDVGGRPLHSAPAFVPITFELTILGAALGALLGFFVLAKLFRLWDPVFEVPGFESASVGSFWLALDGEDASFARDEHERRLRELGAVRVEPFGGLP